jgi:hypothetical protein
LRTASQNFPNEDVARQAQDDMRDDLSKRCFSRAKPTRMPPIAALSLFYDFIDLTPIGPNGDEMIRRMADRLVLSICWARSTASELSGRPSAWTVSHARRSRRGSR